jgi:hypothetical protein
MKTMRFILLGMLLSNYAAAQSIATQTVNSTGGSHRKGNLRLDWSVGEMALVNTLSSPDSGHIITNGVIQPNIASAQARIRRNISFVNNEILILPNPVQSILQVSINTKQPGQSILRLYDEMGNLRYLKVVTTSLNGQVEKIDMTGYLRGNYMLFVEFIANNGSKNKQGFYKIIKAD